MLTMKEPIICKCINPISIRSNLLQQKIKTSCPIFYPMISAAVLLHIMINPPVINWNEGGLTNLVTDATIQNIQELKSELIDQLLNRILLYNTGHFTYQDQVYITSILNRLGIREVSQFMHQLQNQYQETVRTNRLNAVYRDNTAVFYDGTDRLRVLQREENTEWGTEEQQRGKQQERRQERKQEKKSGRKAQQEKHSQRQQPVYYLHRNVYERLQTEEIYRLLYPFYKKQSDFIRLLNREETLVRDRHLSQPEQGAFYRRAEPVLSKRMVTDPVSVLLHNAVDYSYNSKTCLNISCGSRSGLRSGIAVPSLVNAYHTENKQFAAFRNNLYRSADNILIRYYKYQKDQKVLQSRCKYNSGIQNRIYPQENNVLAHRIQQMPYQEYRQKRAYQRDAAQTVRNQKNTEEPWADGQTVITKQITPEMTQAGEGKAEGITAAWADRAGSQQTLYQRVRDRLEQTEQRNRNAQEKLLHMERTAEKEYSRTINLKQAQKDLIRALDNPEQVLKEYLHATNRVEQMEQLRENKLKTVMSAETIEIFQKLREYGSNPEKLIREGTVVTNPNLLLLADIRQDSIAQGQDSIAQKQDSIAQGQEPERIQRPVSELLQENQGSPVYPAEHESGSISYQEAGKLQYIHKKNDYVLRDELIAELHRQRVRQSNGNAAPKTWIKAQKNNEERIYHAAGQTAVRSLAQEKVLIKELVEKSIKKQSGMIAEQVYTKLEKKLQCERKRRGS